MKRSGRRSAPPRRLDEELDRTALHDRTVRPFADPELFPADVDLGDFERYRDAEVRERVSVLTRPALLERQSGWVIAEPFRLVRRGLIGLHTLPAPRVAAYVRARARPGRIRRIPTVVQLSDRTTKIYGHVMQELVGGRLRLAESCGLADVPVLVSRELFNQRYFQDLLRLTGLRDRQFVVQDEKYVRTETTYLCDTSPYIRESIEYLQQVLPIPDADSTATRRVFIVRRTGQRTGRGITNMDEVKAVCRRFGFDLVATDEMALDAQIELFAGARVVAAVHGSALTNMAFHKGSPFTVVDVLPPGASLGHPRAWYFYMARVLGHEYERLHLDPVPGAPSGKAAYKRDFAIDPEHLATALAAVVDRV